MLKKYSQNIASYVTTLYIVSQLSFEKRHLYRVADGIADRLFLYWGKPGGSQIRDQEWRGGF